MRANFETIKDWNVETESGETLGKVVDLELSVENHAIEKYLVQRKKLLSKGSELMISPNQVVKIIPGKIIVKDTVEREQIKQTVNQPFKAEQPVTTHSVISDR